MIGGLMNNDDNLNTKYLYTGQEYDMESELYYYNARYYPPAIASRACEALRAGNPTIGRFISLDPILGRDGNSLTRNGYVYVLNNPLKYVDESGEEEKAVEIDTDWFIETLEINAQYMESLRESDESLDKWYLPIFTKTIARADTYIKFYNLVKSGGPWDYKEYYKKKYGIDSKLIISGVKDSRMNFEAPGNINFGYTGMAAGIPEDLLLSAAGVAQIFAGNAEIKNCKFYFDDPKDRRFIKAGIDLYKHYQLDINKERIKKSLGWNLNDSGFILPPNKNYWSTY